MQFRIFIFFTLVFNFTSAQNHDHHSDFAKKSENLHQTKTKFKPTEDLKMRMEKILNLVKELEPKKNDANIVSEYGVKLTSSVTDLFKNCKLDPATDAAIHPTLGLILEGADEFKKGNYKKGHSKIHKGFIKYEKLFEHDGFKF